MIEEVADHRLDARDRTGRTGLGVVYLDQSLGNSRGSLFKE
jgi:hypothetical protein